MRPAFKLAPIVVGKATFIAIKWCLNEVHIFSAPTRMLWSNMEITGDLFTHKLHLLPVCIVYMLPASKYLSHITINCIEMWTHDFYDFSVKTLKKNVILWPHRSVTLSHDSWLLRFKLNLTLFEQLVTHTLSYDGCS